MKFFAFGLLVLSAALVSEAIPISGKYYDAKDDLLKIISGLKDKIAEELTKLEEEGKKALGSGLEEVEKVLLDIEGQVEKLNVDNAIGKLLLDGLEGLVKQAEKAIEDEVKKLTGSYYDDASDLLNKLLIEGEKLKKEVEEELAKLENEGKSELGKGIEAIEKVILDVEGQLKNLNPDSAVGKALLSVLEGVLEKAEKDLEAEVKKLTGSYYDAKDDLLKIISGLKDKITEELTKLEAEGKKALGSGLEEVEKVLLDIEGQVEKLDVSSGIGKLLLEGLEGLVKNAEKAIEDEVKKLTGSYYDDASDLLNNLLIGGEKLKKEIEEALAKLESEGKAELGKGLEAIEKVVLDIEGQLKKINPDNAVGKAILSVLEGLLEKAEEDLEAEVKKLTGSYYDDSSDLLNNLLIEGEKLKKEVEEELAKLESEGKSELGKGIEAIEKVILDVEGQLKNLNPDSAVGKALLSVLEGVLEKAEKDLEAEVKKLTGSF